MWTTKAPVSEGYKPGGVCGAGNDVGGLRLRCRPYLFWRRDLASMAAVIIGHEHYPVSEREKFNSSNIHRDGSYRPRARAKLCAAPRR